MLRWDGLLTGTSSIAHSGEALGTVNYLRRERMLCSDGTLQDVPLISGNSVRGAMRDYAGTLWWEDAGQPKVTTAVAHAIFSGGALTKSSGDALSGSRLAALKELCPPIGLFGAAGGGRIIDGSAQVGKMVPVCTETMALLPEASVEQTTVAFGGNLPSLWDLTQVEWLSRHPQQHLPDGEEILDDDSSPNLARFGVETFIPGTRFYWWMTVAHASPKVESFARSVVEGFHSEHRGRIGGFGRIGMGQFQTGWLAQPTLTSSPVLWQRNGAALSLDELKTLAWLG